MLDLNFKLQRGDFILQAATLLHAPVTVILGASGSGKSTLLAAIAGLLKPQTGTITLNDRVLVDIGRDLWVPPYRRQIGLVFQGGQLFPHLSVRNNLLYGYKNIPAHRRQFTLEEVVALLEIGSLLNRQPLTLSGGEQQRVALGRTILYSPDLLLFDEPLSALDDRLKSQILPFFLRVSEQCKIPMVYVTHAISEAKALTKHWLLMEYGQLRYEENMRL